MTTPARLSPHREVVRRLWQWFIEPTPVFQTQESTQRRAHLLSGLLLALIALILGSLIFLFLLFPSFNPLRSPSFPLTLSSLLLLALAYTLNHAGRYALASRLTIALLSLGPWVGALGHLTTAAGLPWLMLYVMISVLLSSLLLSLRVTTLLAALQSIGIFLIFPSLVDTLIVVSFMSVLIVVASLISQRDLAQIERQNEQVRAAQERLEALSRQLLDLQEVERRQLARELHDRVGSNLTALNINLDIIRTQSPSKLRTKSRFRLEDSIKLVGETIEHIRDVMAELHPAVLDDYGLAAGLRWYGEQLAERTGLEVQAELETFEWRLPAPMEITLFRIAQEALTNVVKHAHASQVTIRLEAAGERLRLMISDNGIGFSPQARQALETRPRWGLITMQERAETLAGQLALESAPGHGTRIVVDVPRHPADVSVQTVKLS